MASKSTNQFISNSSRFVGIDRPLTSQSNPYTTNTMTFSTTWSCSFMGYCPITAGAAVLKFYLSTPHDYATASTNAYMEAGLYTGEFNAGRATVLRRLWTVDLTSAISAKATPAATVGIKRVVIGGTGLPAGQPTTIAAGTPIWLVLGAYTGSGGTGLVAPVISGSGNDVTLSGMHQANAGAYLVAPSTSTGYIFNTQIYSSGVFASKPYVSLTFYSSQSA
jgi:hypothetical protein